MERLTPLETSAASLSRKLSTIKETTTSLTQATSEPSDAHTALANSQTSFITTEQFEELSNAYTALANIQSTFITLEQVSGLQLELRAYIDGLCKTAQHDEKVRPPTQPGMP